MVNPATTTATAATTPCDSNHIPSWISPCPGPRPVRPQRPRAWAERAGLGASAGHLRRWDRHQHRARRAPPATRAAAPATSWRGELRATGGSGLQVLRTPQATWPLTKVRGINVEAFEICNSQQIRFTTCPTRNTHLRRMRLALQAQIIPWIPS